ncbi:hypothetical protein SLE2022_305100 [Rubroshorea leprosula]
MTASVPATSGNPPCLCDPNSRVLYRLHDCISIYRMKSSTNKAEYDISHYDTVCDAKCYQGCLPNQNVLNSGINSWLFRVDVLQKHLLECSVYCNSFQP